MSAYSALRFMRRSGLGSVPHVFRTQGIHIAADSIAEVVADSFALSRTERSGPCGRWRIAGRRP
jgi:hypothetical protein